MMKLVFVFLLFASVWCDCPGQPCSDSCYYHGECQEDGSCICNQGWEGNDCSTPTCDSCVYGSCRLDGSCQCSPGYQGPACDEPHCIASEFCCTVEGYCSDEEKKPDLIINEETLHPFLHVELFDECHCAVDEGCVPSGKRLLLRFNTETRNIGTADLQIGKPGDNLEYWEWHSCHGHSHFRNFAEFRLVGQSGKVEQSHKSGFCMVDSFPFAHVGNRYYNCDTIQGLQKGWSDWYGSDLDCQWVDVTGLDGEALWKLDLEINPAGVLPELDYTNNLLSVPLVCSTFCDPTIARCLFGQCICNESGHSSTDCTYIHGIHALLGNGSISTSPCATPSPPISISPTPTAEVTSSPSPLPTPEASESITPPVSRSSTESTSPLPSPTPATESDSTPETTEETSVSFGFTIFDSSSSTETSSSLESTFFITDLSSGSPVVLDENNSATCPICFLLLLFIFSLCLL